MKIILVILLVCLTFPCYSKSIEPQKTLINNLINECINDEKSGFLGDDIKQGSIRFITNDMEAKQNEYNDKLTDADNANGVYFRHTYRISYVRRTSNNASDKSWSDRKAEFKVEIQDNVLNFSLKKIIFEDSYGMLGNIGDGCHKKVSIR